MIDDGEFTILNINDCPFQLAENTIKSKVLKDFKKIDFLLTGYGGAGPYPQCLDNLSLVDKIKEGNKKKFNFLKQSLDFINLIKPNYYMPFAGTYVLTGKLNKLQHLRGVPLVDEAYEFLEKNIDKSKNIKAIRLNNDSTYCFEKRDILKNMN